MKLHTLEIDGRTWAVVPMDEFERIEDESVREALEDLTDREALRAARAKGAEMVPAWFAERIWSGVNRIRAWREYREISADDLARKAGISNSLLSNIERGKATGSVQTLRGIAFALGVTIDDLMPPVA